MSTWDDAEQAAAEWMRYWGFTDAQVTPAGPDGGIDVKAADAVAQVKFTAHAVGGPAVQQLYGARGNGTSKRMLFFTGTGYSTQARAYADQVGMALFTYDLLGHPTPSNDTARELVAEAERQHHKPAFATEEPSRGRVSSLDAWKNLLSTLRDAPPAAQGCLAALVWPLPATFLLVGVAATLARGNLTTLILLVTLTGAAAYAFATLTTRRALVGVSASARRVAAAAVMIAPAAVLWVFLAAVFASDPDHPTGPEVWVLVVALVLAGPGMASLWRRR